MSIHSARRYDSIAIALHWLIGLAIIGMLVSGKWMTSLPEDDIARYNATQWHKSIGFTILILVLVRIVWRLLHRPPALAGNTRAWERWAAAATHLLLYLLILAVPVSGWLMVSGSDLSIRSLLFGVWDFPLLPGIQSLDNLASWSSRFHTAHFYLSSVLIVFSVLHILAALRHQLVLRDNLISRMWIGAEHRQRGDLSHGILAGLVLLLAGAVVLSKQKPVASEVPTGAQVSSVNFFAVQMGEQLAGEFSDAQIEFDLAGQQLTASVQTAAVSASDQQVAITLPTAEWFDSAAFPTATFISTTLSKQSEGRWSVSGELTIKGVTRSIGFELLLDGDRGSGAFEIDRTEFNIGGPDQDEFVEHLVRIQFEFSNE